MTFHHSSLFSSYLYTLELRLGHEVYRQIGEPWFKKGFWKINKQKDTIKQYLSTYGYQPEDGTPNLNNTLWVKDGVYYSRDPNTGQVHKAIEFNTFMEMDFDVIIASIPQHIKPFKELARMKGAKFVFQEGNNFNLSPEEVPNLMASTTPRAINTHAVFYHQEFDESIFRPPKKRTQKKIISNYMNVLQNYPPAIELFTALEKEMPDYEFRMYGAQNRDGCLTGIDNIARSMQETRWGFHVKPGGDGFGHAIHNLFATGTPTIVVKGYYDGCLAGQMMNKKTVLIADGLSVKELASHIRASESNYDDMCVNVYNNYKSIVDFEKDAENIQKFLEELV